MTVRWTESALADLRAMEATIARRSPQYSRELIERIFSRSEQLESHPRLGPVVTEFADESIRELYEDSHRIVYRVDDDRIDILAIVHAARRLPRSL